MHRSHRWVVVAAGLCSLVVAPTAVPRSWLPTLAGTALATDAVSFQEMEESLTCQCGCGLTVHACNHLQCPSAIPLREEIRAQMQEGKSKEAILTFFSDKYGEKILSSPTTEGFNLLAWIVPFMVVAVGGLFLGVVLMRWSARGHTQVRPLPEAPAPGASAVAASAHEKLLEKELKNFDG